MFSDISKPHIFMTDLQSYARAAAHNERLATASTPPRTSKKALLVVIVGFFVVGVGIGLYFLLRPKSKNKNEISKSSKISSALCGDITLCPFGSYFSSETQACVRPFSENCNETRDCNEKNQVCVNGACADSKDCFQKDKKLPSPHSICCQPGDNEKSNIILRDINGCNVCRPQNGECWSAGANTTEKSCEDNQLCYQIPGQPPTCEEAPRCFCDVDCTGNFLDNLKCGNEGICIPQGVKEDNQKSYFNQPCTGEENCVGDLICDSITSKCRCCDDQTLECSRCKELHGPIAAPKKGTNNGNKCNGLLQCGSQNTEKGTITKATGYCVLVNENDATICGTRSTCAEFIMQCVTDEQCCTEQGGKDWLCVGDGFGLKIDIEKNVYVIDENSRGALTPRFCQPKIQTCPQQSSIVKRS